MHRVVDELRTSRAADRVLKVGDKPPDFILPDAAEQPMLRQLYGTFPLDLEKFNGDASWTLPMPARFVIDRQGIIRSAESDPDYTTRPEPEDTLEAVRALSRVR